MQSTSSKTFPITTFRQRSERLLWKPVARILRSVGRFCAGLLPNTPPPVRPNCRRRGMYRARLDVIGARTLTRWMLWPGVASGAGSRLLRLDNEKTLLISDPHGRKPSRTYLTTPRGRIRGHEGGPYQRRVRNSTVRNPAQSRPSSVF